MSSSIIKKLDWRVHFIRLLVLGLASSYLIAAIIIRFNYQSSLESTRQQKNQQQALNAESEASLLLFGKYHPDYLQFVGRDYIGSANRLNWIETLDRLAKEIGVPDLNFNLESTSRVLEGETPFFHYDIPIYSTDMHLDMKLLHEGDLYTLLTGLSKRGNGTFSVEECEILRVNITKLDSAYDGLRAKCRLRWFNLEPIDVRLSEEFANASD